MRILRNAYTLVMYATVTVLCINRLLNVVDTYHSRPNNLPIKRKHRISLLTLLATNLQIYAASVD